MPDTGTIRKGLLFFVGVAEESIGVVEAEAGSEIEDNGISYGALDCITGEPIGDAGARELRELRELERGKEDKDLSAGALVCCTSASILAKLLVSSVVKKESLVSANGLKVLFGSLGNRF